MTSNFERKYGKYAIKNLTLYLLIGYVIGYVIGYTNPKVYEYLLFDPSQILQGQIWRIVTWIITVPEDLDVFTIIMFILYFSLGTTLEKTWGTYRYNVYLFSGFLFTVIGSFIVYISMCLYYGASFTGFDGRFIGMLIGASVTTYYINMSIFLAFAATFPDMQLLLYFVIPVKVKYFGFLYGFMIIYDIVKAFREASQYGTYAFAIATTSVVAASLLNFLIYFFGNKRNGGRSYAQVKRKKQYTQSVKRAQQANVYEGGAHHKCVVCGRTDVENPELTFRYCSKCSGSKEYCSDHLFTHTHN